MQEMTRMLSLGLGYDNSLGNEIGITLIATGFEHKDPFAKEVKPVVENKDEKIVLELEMPKNCTNQSATTSSGTGNKRRGSKSNT